ncbi:peptide ABC transporter substrate-binding protein [Ammoniphilus resinae]|uniref:Oligopeptide transport system substrate-binding protein n=1 Tax=Ammoniphilus resinae TaxID=861532 RepID=A0ABS4GY67_9BACL|nr:peptide ABC transporter substrate-binding protein [Ammoniphilus resinae]MBP1935052.1 oligopeptide transport system substrate-binding protein [Ammoniphilus resinae]
MKKRIGTIATGFLLSLSVALSGCGVDEVTAPHTAAEEQAAVPEEKILHLNLHLGPESLHPGLAQITQDSWVLDHLMEGLTKRDYMGKPVPGMAEKWKISDDQKVYTFTLRKDATWSNGDPVTAGDFEFAWKYALAPSTSSESAYILYYLEGASAYNLSQETDPAKLQALADQVGVKALDERTLEVRLAEPTPFFLDLITHYTFFPINRRVQKENKGWAESAETFVSNGPFQFSTWEPNKSIVLRRNESYYDREKVKLDGIDFSVEEDSEKVWQRYLAGDLDVAYPLPPDVISQKNPEMKVVPDLSTYFYRFNTTRKPFHNPKIRKALAMAIDREELIHDALQGGEEPAYGMVPPGVLDAQGNVDFQEKSGELFGEEVSTTRKLLAEGLKEEGLESLPTFTLLFNRDDGHEKIAEEIARMWKENLGVESVLEQESLDVKLEREAALDFDLIRTSWIGDFADPVTFLQLFHSKSQKNYTGWAHVEYDQLIDDSLVEKDPAERMKKLHRAEQILMEEMPIIPVYFYTKTYAAKPYVKGIMHVVNRYPQFQYADISDKE